VNNEINGSAPKRQSDWRKRAPNILTLLRVAIAVVFFVALGRVDVATFDSSGLRWGPMVAAWLFVVAAVTDALDGYLARRWNAGSAFGRIVDPAADKLLVLGAFAILAGPSMSAHVNGSERIVVSGVETWMVVVFIARELLSTSIRAVAEGAGVAFAANWWGKGKMVAQSLCAPLVLALLAVASTQALTEGGWARRSIDIAVWATVVITVASAWPYLKAVGRTFASADIADVHSGTSEQQGQ